MLCLQFPDDRSGKQLPFFQSNPKFIVLGTFLTDDRKRRNYPTRCTSSYSITYLSCHLEVYLFGLLNITPYCLKYHTAGLLELLCYPPLFNSYQTRPLLNECRHIKPSRHNKAIKCFFFISCKICRMIDNYKHLRR